MIAIHGAKHKSLSDTYLRTQNVHAALFNVYFEVTLPTVHRDDILSKLQWALVLQRLQLATILYYSKGNYGNNPNKC